MDHNHATPVGEEKSERRQYHDRTNLPLMVSLHFALQRAGNTKKKYHAQKILKNARKKITD